MMDEPMILEWKTPLGLERYLWMNGALIRLEDWQAMDAELSQLLRELQCQGIAVPE
jgi:hypothetical protein